MEALSEIGEGVSFVLSSILVLVQEAARLNHALVSALIRVLSRILGVFVYIAQGLETGVRELVEQYGELCWGLVQGFGWALSAAAAAVSSAASSALHGAQGVCSLVGRASAASWRGAAAAMGFLGELLVLPFRLLAGLFSGVAMIFSGAYQALDWTLGRCVAFWSGLFGLFTSWLAWASRRLGSLGRSLVTQPWRMTKEAGAWAVERPLEVVAFLLLSAALVYLWRLGVIPALHRRLKRLLWRGAVRLGEALWSGVEWGLTLYAPYVPIVLAIVRRTYRPAFRFLRWLFRLLRRLLFARSHSQGSNTEQRAGERFVPPARPALTPQSSRVGPASPQSPSPQSPERLLCVVCQDAEKSVMLTPCRHICTCDACARGLLDQSRTLRRCPLCRAFIQDTVSVYF